MYFLVDFALVALFFKIQHRKEIDFSVMLNPSFFSKLLTCLFRFILTVCVSPHNYTFFFYLLLTVTESETERMIKLRAANEALFTGRKHSAKPAWR